jgi:sugar phosphate isomerase/epimerase
MHSRLRAEIEDIKILEQYLVSAGIGNIGLCIDVAQLFVVHGNNGIIQFLDELKSIRLSIKEFHISDVLNNEKIKNRVAMEVGTGAIDWQLILPSVLQHCNNLLIETLGGIKVFQRSKSYLESLMSEKK